MLLISFVEPLLLIVLFLLPPYFANAVPVVFGGGPKIDFGLNFIDGKRIFGDGKSWRGFFSGVLIGSLVGYLEYLLLGDYSWFIIGVLTSLGAMFGDLLGSFIKRRLGYPRGHPSLLMDQLLFIIIAYILSYGVLTDNHPELLRIEWVLFVLMVTYFMHRFMNLLANRFGLKKVPW